MARTVGLEALCAFRVDLYGCIRRRADALFELADALLAREAVASLPHLSLRAAHRRGWGSAYAPLAVGDVDAEALRGVLAARPLTGGRPIYADDVSAWPRCDAEARPGRGYSYHPSRHSTGQPIVAGWAYQFCKQALNWTTPRVRHPEQADRWTWLVLLGYTQLRLARRAIDDRHLPRERPQRPYRRALTPARVRQAFPPLLVALDTPADAPKPCGRSPGRPLGRRSDPAPRHPAIKKAA